MSAIQPPKDTDDVYPRQTDYRQYVESRLTAMEARISEYHALHQSEWSFPTLKEHLEQIIRENTIRCIDRIDALTAREAKSEWSLLTLKEHIEKVITDNDRRYGEVAIAQQTALQAALTAAEKAVAKAETAQADKNTTTNEFRGQLSDQAATLMPRKESEQRYDQLRSLIDLLREDLNNMRNNQSGRTGTVAGIQWVIPIIITVLIAALGISITLLTHK